MKTLFLDSSSDYLSLGIFEDKKQVFYSKAFLKNRFNEELLTVIDNALSSIGFDIKDIDEFYVIKGPGSFTGIRIGVSTLLGISLASDKKLYGITSLDALALSSGVKKVKTAVRLRLNDFAVREYDFENGVYSDFFVLKKSELSEDFMIYDSMRDNLLNSFFHPDFTHFLQTYAPFYMMKSQAEINFDKKSIAK